MNFPWRQRPPGKPHGITIKSRSGRNLVGAVVGMTDGGVTYLTDLFVNESYRGLGVGTWLMREFLRRTGGTTIILLTNGAEEFYRKFGFELRTAMVRRPDAQG